MIYISAYAVLRLSVFKERNVLYLCEYEHGENYVNAPLQGLYENGFIEQLKQDERKLQQDAQQPKSSQLWHLPQTHTSKGLQLPVLHFFVPCLCK